MYRIIYSDDVSSFDVYFKETLLSADNPIRVFNYDISGLMLKELLKVGATYDDDLYMEYEPALKVRDLEEVKSKDQLHRDTLRSKSFKWIGTIKYSLLINGCDIGQVTLPDGTTKYCTWGRNLNKKQQHFWLKQGVQTVHLSADRGFAELILPDDVVDVLPFSRRLKED